MTPADGTIQTSDEIAVIAFERRLAHPVDAVWAALTESDQLAEWLGPGTFEPRAGGEVAIRTGPEDRPALQRSMSGRVLTWEPPRVLEYEWVQPGLALSVVLWDQLGAGTRILYTGQRYSFGHEGDLLSVNHLQHLALPVLTLSLVNVAVWSRFQRAVLIEELRSEHVAAARAHGLGERRVVIGHALRNCLAPIVTLVALDLGAMFSGAVVTETVFSWPGMGRLLRDAAVSRDINVAMGIVMIGAVAVIVANLLADLAYAALDPRVDLRGRS